MKDTKPLTCRAARRRLHAFHDRELPVTDQIAVSAHLEWCGECAAAAAEFRFLRAAFQTTMPGRSLTNDEAAAFTSTVVSRWKAEQAASLLTRVRLMFDDLHLVYAGVGATVATAVCLVVMLSMMSFATDGRPDIDRDASLASVMNFLATPGTISTPLDDESRSRWTARVSQAHETAEQEAIFTLDAIVTRDGRLALLDRPRGGRRAAPTMGDADAKLVVALMDAVSRARLAPGVDDAQLSTSLVWLVTSMTVRATTRTPALDLTLPAPAKKHVTSTARPARPTTI